MRPTALAAVLLGALAAVLAWSDWVHWRAHRRGPRRRGSTPGRQAVVVLGCRNRGARANLLNRHRVRVALRSIDPAASETVLVFSGGGVGSDVPEADLLLRHARELGYTGPVELDRTSTTTWQNIENTVPLLRGFDTIAIASNSLHAEKARLYLARQAPDLAARLVGAEDHRPGEILFVKPVAAVRGLVALARARR
ncbi:YdcF family protein [Frigoribacterium faeni]|uniref:Uncharacterized SAM-binding protein YcdF (DUF218 family) n=1 Tax=Frigoribacterium faeni TaxID=145483 RepID=A0A7W3JFC9_9MICO|nr:YdcF family protein [Frigoribacterium faeni]MBA8811809.1 uncharacterized SAM-binding protein YcdF (DUF218 family) [Frigoribacterium faeni]BFF12786.1 hypothetical protein GCM10025699_40890 [Microbacterium flavescens]GEK83295.1 hypothetical protein FFA01_16040 [Frigoribacterium faeni]